MILQWYWCELWLLGPRSGLYGSRSGAPFRSHEEHDTLSRDQFDTFIWPSHASLVKFQGPVQHHVERDSEGRFRGSQTLLPIRRMMGCSSSFNKFKFR
jgi:hypothetical protein